MQLRVLIQPYKSTRAICKYHQYIIYCFIIGDGFNIEVQEAAIANGDGIPAEISICEDDPSSNDGITELTQQN